MLLTVDGIEVEVDEGMTILEAAAKLGIRVPTLCHVPGLEPSSSCFLCAVQVEGMRTLSPSCAMPVSEGMVVTTRSDDVQEARRMALELLLSDHAGDCIAPCTVRCPAGLDIPGFVYELASGDVGRSMEIISETLSLPGALGRICPRLCEESCRRCDHDEALAIAGLHRFAADGNEKARASESKCKESTGHRVGIIGAGPAGMTAAFYLLQEGHGCTVYDAHEQPGGMLRYGIPEYRLPREALDAEIDVIRRLGAEFRMGLRWGEDFSLSELRERHDAVFVAIGAQGSRNLGCDGEELALSGIEFLRLCSVKTEPELGNTTAQRPGQSRLSGRSYCPWFRHLGILELRGSHGIGGEALGIDHERVRHQKEEQAGGLVVSLGQSLARVTLSLRGRRDRRGSWTIRCRSAGSSWPSVRPCLDPHSALHLRRRWGQFAM